MKKLLLAIVCFTMVSNTNAQTVKKIVIDDFTGAWCGNCPIGAVIINGIDTQNKGIVFPVAIHTHDALEMSFANPFGILMGVYGVPSGFVDRHFFSGMGTSDYTTTLVGLGQSMVPYAFNLRKVDTAIASVSFSGASFDNAKGVWTGDVNVAFNTAPTVGVPLTINVFVLEDSIAAVGNLVQENYISAVQNGANPLKNWFHNHVLRMTSDSTWGDGNVIPSSGPVIGTVYTKHVSLTIPAAYVKKNVNVLAFVAYNGTDPAKDGKEILNSERIGLLSTAPAAVNNINKNASFIGVYPNPARSSELVNIEYNLVQRAKVTLTVYNVIGQKVAEPYASEDVAGMHTIQWMPFQQNLAKGTYILQLMTDKGDVQSQRISVL